MSSKNILKLPRQIFFCTFNYHPCGFTCNRRRVATSSRWQIVIRLSMVAQLRFFLQLPLKSPPIQRLTLWGFLTFEIHAKESRATWHHTPAPREAWIGFVMSHHWKWVAKKMCWNLLFFFLLQHARFIRRSGSERSVIVVTTLWAFFLICAIRFGEEEKKSTLFMVMVWRARKVNSN